MVIHKKNTKTKQQNNRQFVPSTNMKKLFKGVLQKNCSQNFGKLPQRYPWSGLFHREKVSKRIFFK